jgi:hypothetical protein
MARFAALFLPLASLGTAAALTATQLPPTFAQAQPGEWDISGLPGTRAVIRLCVPDPAVFAHFEHRSSHCTSRVLKNNGSTTQIEYSCGGAGFGHSDIQVLTPRSLRISTQGISGGLPFNYVLQAHRIDDCQKSEPAPRH